MRNKKNIIILPRIEKKKEKKRTKMPPPPHIELKIVDIFVIVFLKFMAGLNGLLDLFLNNLLYLGLMQHVFMHAVFLTRCVSHTRPVRG